MQFKQTTIAPAGRNKYGNYMSSGNITKSVVTTTYAGNDTTTSIAETGGGQEDTVTDFYVMLSQTSGAFSTLDLAQHITATTQVIAYRGYSKGYTMVLDMDSVAATVQDQAVTNLQVPPNNGIMGVPASGMSINFRNNGTTATTIDISVDQSLTAATEGTLLIPVCVYKRGDNIPLPDDIQNWWEHQYMIDPDDNIIYLGNCEVVWLEWTWKVGASGEPGPPGAPGASGESAWYVSLSNENASVNCDADGNILSGFSLTCKAKLFHGNSQITANSGVTWNVNYGGASGVTRSNSNGVTTLKFGTGFTFTGNSVEITISGSTPVYEGGQQVGNELRDVKVMNITKVYPGENGEPAVSYRISTSFDEVLYDPNTHEWSPHQIMVSAWKRVGDGEEETADGTYIKYSFDSRSNPGTFTQEYDPTQPAQGVYVIPVTSGDCEDYCRIRIVLYKTGSGGFGVQLDKEDIDILWNGVNGTGTQGRQGPAIRGPYDWDEHSGSTRCWCSGTGSTGCDECSKWIDVIVKDGVYYYCNTTYYGSLSPWSSVSSAWTSGDTFDFIATNLLLANGAKIKFLTGNEIYLSYASGGSEIVTGGLAGGTGTTIWSGGDNPDTAPFRVDYQGNIYAESGVFAGYIQMPYTDATGLTHTGGTQYNPAVTYFLDTKAYVIVGPSGVGTPSKVVLPTPTAALNGFVYYLIVKPARLNTQSNTEGVSVEAVVSGNAASMMDYVYQPYDARNYSRVLMYSGKYQFVCAEIDGAYKWLLTEATGGANLYGANHANTGTQNMQDWVLFRPVFGFQSVAGKPRIKNISDETGYNDDNTMYVQL